ncbi:MAG: glycosyltransferase [Neisseria sp.]|nr:glycosyltransferase [Neisseria sp.]
MNILMVCEQVLPAHLYGGTERVVWSLTKALTRLGHQVRLMSAAGSSCDFAPLLVYDPQRPLAAQIPPDTDVVHLHFDPRETFAVPSVMTLHGNIADGQPTRANTIFISHNQAARHGGGAVVHNGLDWSDYTRFNPSQTRHYFHFLGKAAWKVKNVRGAIDTVLRTPTEKLHVLGGHRLNFKMGFRFTVSPRIVFHGMVGGREKDALLNGSKGLVFPVTWHEPFGLALIESLYFGCPIFGTPYGSLPEVVTPEVGVLSNSCQTLSDSIMQQHFLPQRCHEYARDCFNAEVMARAYLKHYEQAINGETLTPVTPPNPTPVPTRNLPWTA